LDEVDFPQALTALDYLKDLENRRRREVAAALQRLNIHPDDLKEKTELAKKYPGVLTWIESINVQGRRVEALYTQIYLGLRRWVSWFPSYPR
jgi:phage-related protein